MKCASCGYSLWNLLEPRCPECGEDWTFESGTVRFHFNECDHPLMHRQPGYGPARCSNCNDVIAWSDVRVVPVGKSIAHRGDRIGLMEGFPIGPAIVVFMVLTCWSTLFMPAAGGRFSAAGVRFAQSSAAFLSIATLIGLVAVVAGVLLAPRSYRLRAMFVWGGIWVAYVALMWRLVN